MSDWEALHEALELWAASQKCVRGHVHLIQEVAERLHAQALKSTDALKAIDSLDRAGHDSEIAADMGLLARQALGT